MQPYMFLYYVIRFGAGLMTFTLLNSIVLCSLMGVASALLCLVDSPLFAILAFNFLLIAELKWFLMELSVLPGRYFAISAHLFPNFLWASMMIISSSIVHLSFLISGFKWLCHLITAIPLPALLSNPPRQRWCYEAPMPGPVLLNHQHQQVVLLLCPRALN